MGNSVPPLPDPPRRRKRRNVKTVGNENGEGVDVDETLVVDEVALTIALAASTPQLLSLDNAQALVNYLDAGDVLECYLLTRKSFLHLDFGLNSTTWNESEDSDNHNHHRQRRRLDDDDENNPGTTTSGEDEDNKNKIPVQTTALGLRYRPPPDSHKQPLTLTLEYGPNRKGRFNSHLSVPQVVGHESPRVHWDNEGQVYFTTFIAPEDYSTASFLAVMTGAVLSDLLTTASLYPTHHRRYQPWQILNTHHSLHHPNDNNDGQQRLFFRSSSDYDFVHYLFKHLASVGVQLSPVLNPVVYRLQLSAVSVQRHTLTQEARLEMTTFYQKLYRCLDSLATATVLTPPPTPGPSPAPIISPAPTVHNGTDRPTSRPASDNSNPTVSPTESSQRRRRLKKKKKTNSTTTEASTEATMAAMDTAETTGATTSASPEGGDNGSTTTTAATTSASGTPDGDDGNTTTSATVNDNSDGSNATETQQTTVNNTDTISNDTNQTETEAPSAANHSAVPSFQPSASPTISNAPSLSWSPTPGPISNADAAAEAAAAAQEAANAAGEAGENPEQAAEAAQQAADAAQKAADATASQQAALRQEALFSGNGEAMTQTVNLCLSDPLYGIAPSQTETPTTLYLYWDSTYYYTVQVTAPFIQVVPVAASLPQPQSQPAFPEGSPLDWFLAFLLVVFFLFSILLTSQHVLGRNFRIVPSLYKLQRWFFDPRNTHYDDLNTAMDEREAKGAGYMYTFGQDSIPRSMGGVVGASSYDDAEDSRNFVVGGRPSLVPLHHHQRPSSPNSGGLGDTTQDPLGPTVFSIDDEDDHECDNNNDEDLGDVELSVKRSSGNSDDQDVLSMSSGGTGGRYYAKKKKKKKKKDPGLVALPDLKSRTKVAVPVSLQLSLHSSAGSSANGG